MWHVDCILPQPIFWHTIVQVRPSNSPACLCRFYHSAPPNQCLDDLLDTIDNSTEFQAPAPPLGGTLRGSYSALYCRSAIVCSAMYSARSEAWCLGYTDAATSKTNRDGQSYVLPCSSRMVEITCTRQRPCNRQDTNHVIDANTFCGRHRCTLSNSGLLGNRSCDVWPSGAEIRGMGNSTESNDSEPAWPHFWPAPGSLYLVL